MKNRIVVIDFETLYYNCIYSSIAHAISNLKDPFFLILSLGTEIIIVFTTGLKEELFPSTYLNIFYQVLPVRKQVCA